MVIFVKVNATTKVMQEEMIKNVSNIEKYQPVSLLNDLFALNNGTIVGSSFKIEITKVPLFFLIN